MKIKTNTRIVSGAVIVTVSVHEILPAENSLTVQYGEPEVDFGGVFDGTWNVDPDLAGLNFTLPGRLRGLLTGLPLTQSFSMTEYTGAVAHAKLWVELIIAACTASMVELNANVDVARGDELFTIS